jgi:hypothetical protein
VEERNGHLALNHHALHQLNGRKLSVLTVFTGNFLHLRLFASFAGRHAV